MPGYRTSSIRTELVTRYPADDAAITTEVVNTVHVIPLSPADLEVLAEKIAHGRKTRRFGIERVEISYRQVVRADANDLSAAEFDTARRSTSFTREIVSAHGKAVRVDGSRGVADGYYCWTSWGRDVAMPEFLAKVVAFYDKAHDVTEGAR